MSEYRNEDIFTHPTNLQSRQDTPCYPHPCTKRSCGLEKGGEGGGERAQHKDAEKIAAKMEASTALIRDRMNGIIARIEPQKLNGATEPGLETLRRQVKYQLDQIVGEGYVKEILVPRCIPYRTDY